MLRKPFRPPLLANRSSNAGANDFSLPEPKRRRLDDVQRPSLSSSQSPANLNVSQQFSSSAAIGSSTPATAPSEGQSTPPNTAYYSVLWRKPSGKKHKTWDGDGILTISDGSARLYDESCKELGSTKHATPIFTGSTLFISGREVEVDSPLEKADFLARKPFSSAHTKPTVRELDEQLRTNVKFNSKPMPKIAEKALKDDAKGVPVVKAVVPSSHNLLKSQYRNPVQDKSAHDRPSSGSGPIPRHDPNTSDALVMPRLRDVPKGRRIVDVVVDPLLSKNLREHQRDGVKFMYECVMGLKPQGVNGCILADEMGLGKTLQVITLMWTLLKQNPIYEDPPVVKKAVVVCPATIIKNWRKEFRKWLSESKVGVFILDGPKARLKDFTHGRAYNVMIVGYERLRSIQADLAKCSDIGLVVADEGHRLKTATNKSAQAIKSLPTERRIMLSGTPLQNDLSEFYFAVDMVNPGLLSKANTFKREFENPIIRSRETNATQKEIEKGKARAAELAEMTDMFMLRRTAEILAKFLPPKTETILFCRPTAAQVTAYQKILSSSILNAALGSKDTAFKLLHVFKKLCNSPSLLTRKRDSDNAQDDETHAALLSEIPEKVLKYPGASGKLQVLDSLLHQIRTTTEEKVVIVSHYTMTLDIIQELLSSLSYSFLRLDGTTPATKRIALIDRFNRESADETFVFLLSAKSGGAGINLIGASRLILFDIDWNPSTDEQAMARIHRDGQNRHCHIYRLLTQGALDEKIFQRQISKRALAEAVVDGKISASTFTAEELRRLFTLDESTKCQTHTLLGCECGGKGSQNADEASEVAIEADEDPSHLPTPTLDDEAEIESTDDELPDVPTLMKASQVDMAAQEAKFDRQKRTPKAAVGEKKSMLALMQYEHLDPRLLSQQTENDATGLDDEVLMQVLNDTEKVGYIFTKTKTG